VDAQAWAVQAFRNQNHLVDSHGEGQNGDEVPRVETEGPSVVLCWTLDNGSD
jgi:hypothetical protein